VTVTLQRAASDPALLGGVIQWWPRQRDLLASLDGPERVHVWAIGRQSGKSSLAACAAVHNAAPRDDRDTIVPRGRTRYVLACAPSEDQAREFVRLCDALIDGSPMLRRMATVKADEIRFTLLSGAKTCIKAMPANSRSVRGLSASLIVLDEFAHFQDTAGPASDEEIFKALEPSTRVFRDGAKVLLISTPNGETGKFYELFQAAENGLLPSARAVHAPVWKVDTTLDDAWCDARRAELGEDVFRQELGAEFVAGGGQFFDLRQVEFVDGPARPEDGHSWVAGLDPAYHADKFGVALVGISREHPGLLLVGRLEGIEPGKKRELSFARGRAREDRTLERVTEILWPYKPRIATDQHQADAMRSHFGRLGWPVHVVNLTAPIQTAAFTSLRTRLIDGSLECWKHPPLVEELRRVRSAATVERIELPRFAGSHCDIARVGRRPRQSLTLVTGQLQHHALFVDLLDLRRVDEAVPTWADALLDRDSIEDVFVLHGQHVHDITDAHPVGAEYRRALLEHLVGDRWTEIHVASIRGR
jgi:hypothetical protein